MTPLRRVFLLAGLSLSFGAVAVAWVEGREQELRSRIGSPIKLLVTARATPAGIRLGPESLAVRAVPARWAPPGAAADPASVYGMVTTVSLPAGAYLTAGSWRDANAAGARGLQRDERVATVVAFAPPGTVRVGVRVDVVVARAGRRSRVELTGVEVLGVRDAPDGSPADAGHTVEADLRTRIDGALRLAEAAGEGAAIRLLPIGSGTG